MNKRSILYLLISLIFGVSCFVATSNFIVSGIVLVLSILYFLILAEPRIKKANESLTRFHECYRFINAYIISINVKGSLSFAFESVKPAMSDSYLSLMDGINDLNDNEKLTYLSKYFPFHVYSLFLNVIQLWQEQGGDILSLSSYLIDETRNVEEYLVNSERIAKRKIIEFSSLWFFSIAILLTLRFALSQFYQYFVKLIYYPISVGAFFIFILFSIHVVISKAYSYQIKGWNNI